MNSLTTQEFEKLVPGDVVEHLELHSSNALGFCIVAEPVKTHGFAGHFWVAARVISQNKPSDEWYIHDSRRFAWKLVKKAK